MMSARERGGGREDNPYCSVCCDRTGTLLGYEEVAQRMAEERFVKVNGMPKKAAEEAAHRALKHMPAWKGRS